MPRVCVMNVRSNRAPRHYYGNSSSGAVVRALFNEVRALPQSAITHSANLHTLNANICTVVRITALLPATGTSARQVDISGEFPGKSSASRYDGSASASLPHRPVSVRFPAAISSSHPVVSQQGNFTSGIPGRARSHTETGLLTHAFFFLDKRLCRLAMSNRRLQQLHGPASFAAACRIVADLSDFKPSIRHPVTHGLNEEVQRKE